MDVVDRSRLDYAVAVHLHHYGFDEAAITGVLMHGSAKAQERGADYASQTARAAVTRAVRKIDNRREIIELS